MKNLKLFEEFELKNKTYNEREVVMLIMEVLMIDKGDEWVIEEDDNFKHWLESNGLLETFEKIINE